jgi:hypothetical protein
MCCGSVSEKWMAERLTRPGRQPAGENGGEGRCGSAVLSRSSEENLKTLHTAQAQAVVLIAWHDIGAIRAPTEDGILEPQAAANNPISAG